MRRLASRRARLYPGVMDLPYHTRLTAAQQQAAGLTHPAPLAIADIVHHDDLDSLDHVNNTRYFTWFERLRIRHMTHYGIGTLNDPSSPRIVIRSGEVRFVAELRGGETYITTCHCTALRTTSMTLSQEIWAAGTLRATFSCVMVLLTQDGSARQPIPEAIRAKLIADGAAPA